MSSKSQERPAEGYMGQDHFEKSPDKQSAYPSQLKPEVSADKGSGKAD